MNDGLIQTLLAALGALQLILNGALPEQARRWVGLVIKIAQVTLPIVQQFTGNAFQQIAGDDKARIVVQTIGEGIDTIDDELWVGLTEKRKDRLIGAVSELALFIIDASSGELDRRIKRRQLKRAHDQHLALDEGRLAHVARHKARALLAGDTLLGAAVEALYPEGKADNPSPSVDIRVHAPD